MSYPHLTRAPIREALIDIQVKLNPDIKVDALKALHEKIKSKYPTVEERQRWESSFELTQRKSSNFSVEVDGYILRSQDNLQVAQYRINGFTFSRLNPYQDWNQLRDEAQKLWSIFKETGWIASVTRAAVRYINMIEVPIGSPLGEMLKNPPKPPDGGPNTVASFLNRQLIQDTTRGLETFVTTAMEPRPNASKIPIVLDIDVFKSFSGSPSESELWEVLEKFRDVKNQMFFGSITDKAVEMYK